MDVDPQTLFKLLNEYAETNGGFSECFRLLSTLNSNLTEEQVDPTIIDSYLLCMFNKTSGIAPFLSKITSKGQFKKPVVISLEIIYALINNFPKLLERYILDVNELCMKVNQGNATFEGKIKALEVLLISFEKIDKCLENQEHYLRIFKGLQTSLNADHSDSIKHRELIVMGLFCKKFAYVVNDPSVIKINFINILDKVMVTTKSQHAICGAFTGLTYFCESFPLNLENNSDRLIIEKLYKHIKQLSIPKEKVKIGNRAALMFLSANVDLFLVNILAKFKEWHGVLLKWLGMGSEERKTGISTLKAYFNGMSKALYEMPTDESKTVLAHFVGWPKQVLKKENSSTHEVRLAIHCLKFFSRCYYKHMSTSEVNDLFVIIMENFEKFYILNQDPSSENWEYLPDYIQCVASFMRQNVTPSYLFCLQRAVVNMIRTFHQLETLHHVFVVDAFVHVIFCLKGGAYFESFLESVIYQGIVWSCSHQHISEADIKDDSRRIVTVKNYFLLWISILKLQSNRSYDKYGIYLEDRRIILTAVTNQFIKTLMVLINKLDVNMDIKEGEDCVTDIENTYKVSKISDYAIFLNVVDFYQEILNQIDPNMFERCISKIINHLIDKCVKHPFISGFYKLLSFKLKIANKLHLFESDNITLNQDVHNCRATLTKFIDMLLHKMQQFKDELLISCLHVLLQSPTLIIQNYLNDCVGVFKTVFELGRSYISLAHTGLDTLEHWQKTIDKEAFEPFLIKVIPGLDAYLRSKSLGSLMQTAVIEKRRKTSRALKKRKVTVELEPELVKLQQKVLRFVGSQNGKVCRAFVCCDNNITSAIIGENLHLKVSLPYDDMNVDVHLEPFIPRLVDLALNCSDRKSRITTCELLQASILVFLGKTKPMTGKGLSELDSLLKCIATPLLQLSCDMDQIVKQIFEPLFLQIIHWYTSNFQTRSGHAAIIIETIMEGVTHPTNSGIRDFSGKCINEYVKWTIKQTGRNRLADDPVNIKILVKKMRFFSSHPDPCKKLGAALIFNNIYRELREEQSLINIFWVEILHIFIESLSTIEYPDLEAEASVTQIFKALQNWKRVFLEKNHLFLKSDERRRVPIDLKDGTTVSIATWLFYKSSSKSQYCRDACMDLFISTTFNEKNPKLKGTVMNGIDNFNVPYEERLEKFPTLNKINNIEDCSVLIKWLQTLFCAIDGHNFILKNKLSTRFEAESCTFKGIEYFLDYVQTATFEQCLNLISIKLWSFTEIDKQYYNSFKASCNLALLLLGNTIIRTVEDVNIFNESFWKLSLNAVFNPQDLGFDHRIEQPKHLDILRDLLQGIHLFRKKISGEKTLKLIDIFDGYIKETSVVTVNVMTSAKLKQRNLIKGLLFLKKSPINELLKVEKYTGGLVNALLMTFYENVEDKVVFINDLPQTVTDYCSAILEFALDNNGEFQALLSHFFNGYKVHFQSTEYQRRVPFGIFLLSNFEEVLMHYCWQKNFKQFLQMCLRENDGLDHIVHILNVVSKNKKVYFNSHLLEELLKNWNQLKLFFEGDKPKQVVALEFLNLLQNLVIKKQDTSCIVDWLSQLIVKENLKNDIDFQIDVFSLIVNYASEDNIKNISEQMSVLSTFSSNLEESLKTKPVTSEKLLMKLTQCKSVLILEFLLNNYINADIEIEIDRNLSKFTTMANADLQRKSLMVAYDFANKDCYNFDRKMKIANNILPPILRSCNLKIFEEFYVENILKIMTSVSSNDNISKAVHYVLVELLFSRIPVGSEDRTGCPIIEASNNPKLRLLLVKHALDILKDQTEQSEVVRVLKCKAYKALASIFTNCVEMKKEALFEKLFYRSENGEDILWKGLINTELSYNFPVEFDSLPKQRKILVNIRDELHKQRKADTQHSLKYIESQRLFESSLSEDITNYDFTNSVLRNSEVEKNDEDVSVGYNEIYLDATEINSHECMATVCAVIKYIFESGINDIPKEDDEDTELPSWMEGIQKVLICETTHKNVKIFLVKLIENMESIFRHYARWFVGPLLQFISEKCAGDSVSYFITDVLVVIASWATIVTPDEDNISHISEVLSFLIAKLNNERQDMFKYNLDLIKLLAENWKEHIKAPSLLPKFDYDIDDRKIEVAIHLSSVLLANNIDVCGDVKALWRKLSNIMNSKVRSIYRPCAETIGLFFKYLENNLVEHDFQEDMHKLLRNLSDIDKYALSLEGITNHFPKFVNAFHLCKMINRLSQSPTNIKILFLKVINKTTDQLDEVIDFERENWGNYVENDNLDIQLVTLEIILKTLSTLCGSNVFNDILKSLAKMLSSPNVLTRSLTYDVFITILEKDICEEEHKSICREVLIQGLVDSDYENREKIRKFWSEYKDMPSQITQKFSYLLSKLYSPKTEGEFLGYSSYFLLNTLIDEDNDTMLFDDPLEDCDFENYRLQLNWRLKHPSEVPLFAETLRSFQESVEPYTEGSFNQLRNTQADLSFAPTQSLRDQQISQLTNISSSLLVNTFDDGDGTFKNPNSLQLSQRYKLPKRRFLKDQAKMSMHFAHYEVRKQQKKVERRFDAIKEGEKKVTIYRNYRKGDFPDIQIALSAIVKPLQILALFDGEISKTLFSSILKSLSNKIEDNKQFLDSVLESIKHIFSNSTQFTANLFSTLLDILLKNKSTIVFDPQLLSTACQQSGLVSIGALLLEEYIISYDDDGPSPSKKGTTISNETMYWLKLAELYRELEEWELVRTIFVQKINCKDTIQVAINHEANKRWREAQESYQMLIETDISAERKDFYYESYFKCLAHLGEWEALPKAISSIVPNEDKSTWEVLWDGDWYQQKLLPWYVTSQVRRSLFANNVEEGFLNDLNSSYLIPEQNEYLRLRFSEELCLLWLFKRDVGQANQYLTSNVQNFLNDWQLINPMFENLRYNKLLRLCNVIEVDTFVRVENNLNDDCEIMLKQIQEYWKESQSEFLPSILLSEAKLLYRRLFLNVLIEKVSKLRLIDVERQLRQTRIQLDISFMKVAIENENYYMARKYYKEYETLKNFNLSLIYGNIAYLKSQVASNSNDQFKILLASSGIFSSLLNSSKNKTQMLEANLKYFNVNLKIADILSQNTEIFESNLPQIQQTFGSVSTPQEIPVRAAELLKNNLINDFDDTMDCDSNYKTKSLKADTTADAFVKLAYFVKDNESYIQDFILYVLRAMRLNSKEARQLFPCILLEENLGNEFKDVFIKESDPLPTWMFLRWIPQLLANVDSSKVVALSKIILRIAEAYPQAIMYAYRLSKENYSQQNSAEVNELLEKLDNLLLNDPKVDKFLKALSNVSVPIASLRYYVKKMFDCKGLDEMMSVRQKLLDDFFGSTPDSRDINNMQGNMFKTVRKFKNNIQAYSGLQFAKIRDELRKMDETLKTILAKEKLSVLLQDYCPWLAHFSANKLDIEIEIPGQYTGEEMPLVQHHVKISGFLPNVRIMSSLRKPIKIIMLGMNSKEYPFLIKFGEDIRQDQRVQQLFTLMNNIFASDNRDLSVLTYEVVPLTSNLGIIEWIDPTTPLGDFVKRPIKDRRAVNAFEMAVTKYVNFLCSGKTDAQKYGNTAVKKDRNKLVPFFQGIVNSVDLDVLKKSFWTLGTSTEDFIALRSNFIKSYAVLCVCHWVLGIGDRHLSNSLICVKNGKVLGIDFGHAFGTGTQIQPIPELVPFRLTPHILAIMEPLREKGTFRDVMIATLRSLRNNSSSLLATMNVFIQEPSIDWLENASKSKFESSDEDSPHEWYPKQKVDQAKRKLNGASSTEIMIEDLRASKNKELRYVEAYIRHVKGSAEYNRRATMNVGKYLTVEQQVDCLIDHAVDYNLLGRMYCGWYPWI